METEETGGVYDQEAEPKTEGDEHVPGILHKDGEEVDVSPNPEPAEEASDPHQGPVEPEDLANLREDDPRRAEGDVNA